ncbi:MAG: hypothetical protein IIC74_07375 [Bacteroidetes bacterium]|nr:hypothetical protein [Bacteroidota bacterium]
MNDQKHQSSSIQIDFSPEAARHFSMKTKSRVTFEYILLEGINDSEQEAKRLANLLRGPAERGDYWVNLIAYNPVPGLPYKRPPDSVMEKFKDVLEKRHVPVYLRKPQGVDINAGCGQLGEAI